MSTANAFYRVESSNLSFTPIGTTFYHALSTSRYINLTPANAGNYKGFGFHIASTVTGNRSITVEFQHGQTATLAVASPGVVGLVAHGFAVGTAVQFTTTGTLPTGVVSNTIYYARNTDCAVPADQFWLYGTKAQAIAGGTTGRINFTGSPSGTHTCWVVRATETKTFETIRGGFTSSGGNTTYDKTGQYLVNMNNPDVNYAFTTAANTWRIRVYQSGGTTGTLNIGLGANATNYSYWFYGDNQLSFSNGDTPIFAHYCDIDQTANFNSVLGTGETALSTAGVICTNEIAQTPDDVAYLRCISPAASYTLTLNGYVWVSGHSGFRFGTSASPISVANRLIVNFGAGTVGTNRGGFINPYNPSSTNYYYSSRASAFAYGEYPTKIRTYLTEDTATLVGNEGLTCTMTIANPCVVTKSAHGYTGSEPVVFTTTGSLPTGGTTDIVPGTTYYVKYVNSSTFRLSTTPGGADISTLGGTQSGTHFFGAKSSIVVAEDMSLQGWGAGDTIVVGKQAVQGPGYLYSMKIESISGTTINLTHILPGYRRLSGGTVFNLTPSKYGINFVDTGTNTQGGIYLNSANNINLEGCYIKGMYISGTASTANRYYDDDNNANLQPMTFKNLAIEMNGTVGVYFLYNTRIPRLGQTIDNVWGFRTSPTYGIFHVYATSLYSSGTFTMNNVGVLNRANYYMGNLIKCKCLFSNIYIENGVTTSNYGLVLNLGANSVVDGVYIYGDNGIHGSIGITSVSINSSIKNVYITNCKYGVVIASAAVAFGLIFENVVMSGNTINDLYFADGAYINAVFKNCNGITTRNYTNLTGSVDGTKLAFVNDNDVANADFSETTWGIFTRTGDGLTDTTVHTSGTGKFAVRLESKLAGTPLELISDIPTGNIQNQDMAVGVWCKLNSANYYAGTTYTMPRLTVTYDDGVSTAYAEAAQTTDWQFLFVPFTPTTTFGQITVSLSADTDATSTDRYVYFDDFSTFFPPGVQLSLGGLDLWADALPIVPYVATNVNASDVWAFPKVNATASGSMGEMEVQTNQLVDDVEALTISKL